MSKRFTMWCEVKQLLLLAVVIVPPVVSCILVWTIAKALEA